MAFTVDAAFNTFFDTINLSGNHRDTANSRREHLIGLLGNSFSIVDSFSMGSIPKFTALSGHADLDIMLVLNYEKYVRGKTPVQVIQSIRDALAQYKTNVRKNGQAVTLYYQTWPNVDVVPVYQEQGVFGSIIYNVPDIATNSWIKSNPKNHANDIENKSSECGQNFRRIIKMIKHWSLCHNKCLSSYHIEVLALKIFNNSLDDLTWNVFKFFDKAIDLLKEPMWHSFSYVDSYISYLDRQTIINKIIKARDLSREAWNYTYGANNKQIDAMSTWGKVFTRGFPTYG